MMKKWAWKLACLGLFGYLITTMDWCPCCGAESCCDEDAGISDAVIQSWLDQAAEERFTANSGRTLSNDQNTNQ